MVYNKYKNKKVVVDGITFDSRKEAKRYSELKFMERCGLIKDLELQKPYELQPKFRKNNKTYQKITYIADFTYYDIEREQIVVEDVKGYKTDVYKLKKKLFEYKYLELELREV